MILIWFWYAVAVSGSSSRSWIWCWWAKINEVQILHPKWQETRKFFIRHIEYVILLMLTNFEASWRLFRCHFWINSLKFSPIFSKHACARKSSHNGWFKGSTLLSCYLILYVFIHKKYICQKSYIEVAYVHKI